MKQRNSRPRIGITLGDPAGIGPEIIAAALGSRGALPDCEIRLIGERHGVKPGKPTEHSARMALAAMEEAALLADSGEIDAVVTGPVSKFRLHEVGFEFPGQTEFFAARWHTENFAMCLTGGGLTVGLVTAHIPLAHVPLLLSGDEIVRVGGLLAEFIPAREAGRSDGPRHRVRRSVGACRIAVAGLNPHAGEDGMLGSEENEVIAPAVAKLQRTWRGKAQFTGPISPDTVFHRAVHGEFDAVLCMYHDQGLIPLKLHAFDSGVNVTLGLPHPRTSPDHGTAYDIAGKGSARPDSMLAAIHLAARMAHAKRR